MRCEINEGLNVVEQWNGATDFVFFARRGELSSNRREDHEISMLALHLIQNCLIYINTLMIQKVLSQQHWQGRVESLCSGTRVERRKVCGKLSDRGAPDPAARPGPSYEGGHRKAGQRVHRPVSAEQAEGLRQAIKNYRQLQQLLRDGE